MDQKLALARNMLLRMPPPRWLSQHIVASPHAMPSPCLGSPTLALRELPRACVRRSTFLETMTWGIRCFWTVNIALSPFFGYLRTDGVVEMRRPSMGEGGGTGPDACAHHSAPRAVAGSFGARRARRRARWFRSRGRRPRLPLRPSPRPQEGCHFREAGT